jgi:hypothetical protein
MEVSQWEMRCDVCLAVAPGPLMACVWHVHDPQVEALLLVSEANHLAAQMEKPYKLSILVRKAPEARACLHQGKMMMMTMVLMMVMMVVWWWWF